MTLMLAPMMSRANPLSKTLFLMVHPFSNDATVGM
jgi:hypothetical protein